MATTSQHVPTSQADVDALNSLLRGEISSVETYDQAIDKFQGSGHGTFVSALTRIRDEHNRSVSVLRDRVLAHGGKPSEGAGVWGVFANLVEGAAKLFGPQTALAALKQGELYGKEQYEKTVEKADVTTECRFLIRNDLMPKCQQHITALEQMMAQIDAKQ